MAVARTEPVSTLRSEGRTWPIIRRTILYVSMSTIGFIAVFPFLWSFLGSFKTSEDLFDFAINNPSTYLPVVWKFDNYTTVWALNFGRFFLNSAFVSASITLAHLILASTAGYAFARLEFRGRDLLFVAVIATLMVPFQVTMVPLFIMIKNFPFFGGNNWQGAGGFGMVNTYWGLIIPMFPTAYGTFLLRQFFQTLPKELEDAARIDGASEFRIYWNVMLPLSGAALAVLTVFSFQFIWNDFVWPFIITKSEELKTIQVGLANFRQEFTTDWGLLMAATMVATLPVLFLFLMTQRYFVQGIALSGIKG
jgi:multiple sugar transport system permease protein